ncbi:MAG: hypothetical protein IT436_00985 [Phycisphaerales bacterium]|nr:hypothetical protein [Phycisphaerales bacterium]
MDSIRQVVRAAARRLFLIDVLRTLAVTLTVALSGLILARFTERLFGLDWSGDAWLKIFIAAPAAALVAAVVWSACRRARLLGAARELDERAGLREALSTALCVESAKDDPWSEVVVETARQRAVAVKVGQAIPITAPRLWPVPFGAALALMILWMSMPAVDVLGLLKKKQAVQQQKQQLIEVKADVAAKEKKLQDMLSQAKVDLTPEEADKEDVQTPGDPQKPEDIQRAAVRKLTDLSDRLKELRDNEKGEQLKAMRDAVEKLKQPGDGPLSELSRQLARGNFDKAQEELDKLQQKLAEGSMSEKDAEKLKEQMKSLAQQMDKVAADQEELAKQLEKAGLDPKKAADLAKKGASAEELQKALQDLANLSPEQREKLMKMAMAQKQASDKMGQMSQAMSQCASGMSQQGMNPEGMQGMEAMGAQLSQMEQMQGDMAALDAALDEANSQLAELGQCLGKGEGESDGDMMGPEKTGEWAAGEERNRGNGKGGPGRGQGGNLGAEAADYTVEKKKASSKTTAGPIIGSRLVYGEQVRGESRQAYESAVEAASQSATEAMESMQIDPELHSAIKSYFGTLGERAKPKAEPAKPAPAQPPAPDAKDAGKK